MAFNPSLRTAVPFRPGPTGPHPSAPGRPAPTPPPRADRPLPPAPPTPSYLWGFIRPGPYRLDLWALAFLMALVGWGIVFVFSASYPLLGRDGTLASASRLYHEHLKHVFLGLGVFLVTTSLAVDQLKRPWWPILLLAGTSVLLILCFIPPFACEARGTHRWMTLKPVGIPLQLQPSEIGKVTVVLVLAWLLTKDGPFQPAKSWPPLRRSLLALAPILLPIVGQEHLGMVLVIGSTTLVLFFLGGIHPRFLGSLLLLGLMGTVLVFFLEPDTSQAPPEAASGKTVPNFRIKRLQAWWNPLSDPQGFGYQSLHCITGLARGGGRGRGIPNSLEKQGYLPEPYTDSILAVIGEEWGLGGTVGLLLLFIGFCGRGFRTALLCQDPFHRLLASGLASLIFLQAALNYAVITNTVPQTGIGLPFVSYGGTSFVALMGAAGLLLNLSRYAAAPSRPSQEQPVSEDDPLRPNA